VVQTPEEEGKRCVGHIFTVVHRCSEIGLFEPNPRTWCFWLFAVVRPRNCQISVKSTRMLAFCRHPFRSSTFRIDAHLRPSAIPPNEGQNTLPQRRALLPLDICILGRTSASAASEHCPGHKATTSRIVVVEEPTHQLSCGIKAADRTSCSIKHPRVCIDT
jgi:hypothetical protein